MLARWFILMTLIWFPTISWADFPQEIEETNTPQVQLFSVEQSSYQAFRAEITLHTDLASLLLLFQDVPKQSQWIYRCKEASILKKKNEFEYIIHHVLDAPWPLEDRDSISYIRVDPPSRHGVITIHQQHHQAPMLWNTTRPQVEKINGFWKLIPMTEDKVHVILQLHVEPGGVIPAWIVNLAIRRFPQQTLLALQRMIEK